MRGRHLVTTVVVSVLAAFGAGYFLGVNHTRNQAAASKSAFDSQAPGVIPAEAAGSTTTTSDPTAATASVSTTQQYTVKKGDTLSSIGKQYNISWPVIAKANNLADTTPLKEGQQLVIPSTDQAKAIQAHEYIVPTTDEEKQTLQMAQDYARAGTGQLAYRLVPTQVVEKTTLLTRFQFAPSDLYVEKSKDLQKGEAVVEVTHAGGLYTVYLSQPLDKGDKGVWTPVRVTY